MEISEILSVLAEQRPIFHSEADFQHALAWEVHTRFPQANVRLEFPVALGNNLIYVDMWIVLGEEVIAVELKYKTRGLSVEANGEQFHLKNQGAQDIGRYDFLKDIRRLEQVSAQYRKFTGCAILLTNDSVYWTKPARLNTIDADFRIHDERVIEGILAWSDKASDGTKENRERAIELQGKYHLRWTDYSCLRADRYGKFRSLVVKVV